ncbi:universal stress protein [Singulisphaera sp. PoT]|uniref:universal stress protein n=1 Tax=Singulisphaera sp. PoT TaxID=3411797 RepID=UPI003BF616E1
MRFPQRLWTVVTFAAVGMIALFLSGMLDWITSVLFMGLEFLAESLRPVLKGFLPKKEGPKRLRTAASSAFTARERPRRSLPRRAKPKQLRGSLLSETEPAPAPIPVAIKARVLVPISGDRPSLIAFALRECQERHAELIVLFLRPIAYTPMGPNALPTLAEDKRAGEIIDRIALEAAEAGIALRVQYRTARDIPGTILEVARTLEADVLLMEATRRNILYRALAGDQIQSVMMQLPERVSLLIHAA